MNLSGRDDLGGARGARETRRICAEAANRRGRQRLRLSYGLAKPAEWSLYVMLATGVLLFDPLHLPWSETRWFLVLHIIASAALAPSLLIPYWLTHRALLRKTQSSFHVCTGRVIEFALILLLGSGVWLALVGANGALLGAAAHWIHLALTVPLALLVIAHAWRASVLRNLCVFALPLLLGFFLPPASSLGAPASAAAVESRSLIAGAGGAEFYSANGDAGSVSKIDARTGARLAEADLGGDIRTLALDSAHGVLAASDDSKGAVYLLDANTLAVRRTIAIPGRPYGLVYDARNRLFWATASEAGRLYGIGEDGAVRADLKTEETPRGLALLPDGRLLVTLSMLGKVAIYDVHETPPHLVKTIALAVERNQDQMVSQGLPRVLDRIVVSPDLKQAWLPHELWNFTHPFQFQSTVFPAISVLILTPGHEREAVSQRKQLFKQINLVETGNRARIVSNPTDAAFAPNGSKVYAVMSGSEDLVVFDLARAPPVDSNLPGDPGAKAVQIFRHLPGADPHGILIAGDNIYVQNAMSLDLSRLTTGGSGPFARVGVKAAHFAALVARDPAPPAVRRGERLFDLGNSDVFPKAPMAGDNWMSCSSCHVDGFNFTNKYLFRATPVAPFHSSIVGHANLKTLVAGDFVGDYIRMIRDTQGGMGADVRFPTPNTDPDHPPPAVSAMMKDLHAYVVSPGNLPLLSTWLRGENGSGSVDPNNWINSAVCSSCHQQIFKDWANSMHHHMGQSNPYYEVMEDLAAKSEGPSFRNYCMGCHSPQALLSGETATRGPSHLFDKDGAALMADLRNYVQDIDEGAGCLTCHRTMKLEDAGRTGGANASMQIELAHRPRYAGEDSNWAALRWFADRQIRAKPDVHASSLSPTVLSDPKMCSSCHDEFTPADGAYIISTYDEWAHSRFNAPNTAANRSCMDCHMHADVAKIGKPIPGRATEGGPIEANVFTHGFAGGQYQLDGLRDPKLGALSKALLKSAARLAIRADGADGLVVRVTNEQAGHDLPTGLANFRQMWLQVSVVDANGRTILDSGALDRQGRLDKDARLFHEVLGDSSGHDVGMEFWRYTRLLADTRIPANGFRDERFELPASAAYPLTVHARLMFRTYPEWITAAVQKRFPKLPTPQPVTMASRDQTLERR